MGTISLHTFQIFPLSKNQNFLLHTIIKDVLYFLYILEEFILETEMQKCEYSSIVFTDNNFIFYENNNEPKSLFQIEKSSIFGVTYKSGPDFDQKVVNVINKIAEEGWELSVISPGGFTWFFKRPTKG